MTHRAGVWATTQVGRHERSVAWAAKELGVTWHTVMDAVTLWGELLIEDPGRVGATSAIGVDETSFLAATATECTRWVSSICDVEGHTVIDLIEGARPLTWTDGSSTRPRSGKRRWPSRCAISTSRSERRWSATFLRQRRWPTPSTWWRWASAAWTPPADGCRTTPWDIQHRGRKADPLYRCRKLLAMAEERLEENGTAKLRGLLAAGDPLGHVHEAWTAKECLRDLYTLYDQPELAGRWIDGLIEDCRDARAPEVRGVARTLKRWRDQVANSIALNSIYSSTHSTAGIGLLALPLCMWLLALALVAAEWIWRRPWSL